MTHRCHNRDFLPKFACDREGYRAKLREYLGEFEAALLGYYITSNHVHLLLDAEDRMQISGLMRSVAGEFARAYNRRKKRMNAFETRSFLPPTNPPPRQGWQHAPPRQPTTDKGERHPRPFGTGEGRGEGPPEGFFAISGSFRAGLPRKRCDSSMP